MDEATIVKTRRVLPPLPNLPTKPLLFFARVDDFLVDDADIKNLAAKVGFSKRQVLCCKKSVCRRFLYVNISFVRDNICLIHIVS